MARLCWTPPLGQLIRDLAGGRRHELTENMRSDPGIFNFVSLPWMDVTYCKCGTRTGSRRGCGPTCAGGRGEACGGTAARGRTPARAAADGGAVQEGQPITRALQRSCCAVQGDCARGHSRACGVAEHSGLGGFPATREPGRSAFFHVFAVFFCAVSQRQKRQAKRDSGPFFVIFLGAAAQR